MVPPSSSTSSNTTTTTTTTTNGAEADSEPPRIGDEYTVDDAYNGGSAAEPVASAAAALTLPDPALTHPSITGYTSGLSGRVLTRPSLVTPVMAGVPWTAQPIIMPLTNPAHVSPATVGYIQQQPDDTSSLISSTSTEPAMGTETGTDPARIAPAFAGSPPLVAAAAAKAADQKLKGISDVTLAATAILPGSGSLERSLLSLAESSEASRYLSAEVWPVLGPALERLLASLPLYRNTGLTTAAAPAAPADPAAAAAADKRRDLDAIYWLATYLKRNNPRVPPSLSPEVAAVRIQAGFRGMQARNKALALARERDARRAAKELEMIRNSAATRIQAAFRGHTTRMHLALGHRDAFLG